GGVPVLTRSGDAGLSARERTELARETRPAAVVSLHTHAARDRRTQGFAVFYHQPAARGLGEAIRLSLAKKMGLVDRGLHPAAGQPFSSAAHQPGSPKRPGEAVDGPPAVTVETVTISNPVEEGWLRSYVFRQRVAQAVFNGLSAYLRVTGSRRQA
ncbi:MAG TPA: N-acetylmuramoyl-L-alanine amidase, partial [Firmicutes bacterium]|nr:N-acetylmuramoyl-L-alanine amidase [Bacillota bacterium]